MGAFAPTAPSLKRLLEAWEKVAGSISVNPAYLPIFERLDAECEAAEAAQARDPVRLARLMVERSRMMEQGGI